MRGQTAGRGRLALTLAALLLVLTPVAGTAAPADTPSDIREAARLVKLAINLEKGAQYSLGRSPRHLLPEVLTGLQGSVQALNRAAALATSAALPAIAATIRQARDLDQAVLRRLTPYRAKTIPITQTSAAQSQINQALAKKRQADAALTRLLL